MKATIFSNKDVIGTANLEVGDFSMGGLYGDFYPNDNYFSKIQKYVWKFWSSKNTDFKEWNSLKFNIQLENEMFLMPIGGITFDDIEELKHEQKRIDLAGVDTKIIEDFIITNTITFLEEPWESISIEQKLAFENELEKEINPNHILADSCFSAFSIKSGCDDVLFEINSKKFEQQFALVHLTWKGKNDDENFPKIELFKDFNEFKYLRMFPDKIDWEY